VGKTADELRFEIQQQRNELSRDLEAVGDRVSPRRMVERRKASVRNTARRAKDAVMGSADSATTSVTDRASSMKGGAADVVSSPTDTVTAIPNRIESTTEGNPLAAGFIAFGAGLLAASLIPQTQRESQMASKVQPTLAQAAAQAGSAAQDAVSELKPQVQSAVEDVKSTAQSAAKDTVEDAKSAAHDTKNQAQAQTPTQQPPPTRI